MPETDGWFDDDTATLGDRLTAAREQAGMTRKALAKRLGVKPGTVAGWEEDRSEPRANKLSLVSGVLNVSLPWLLMGEGDGPDSHEPLPAAVQDLLAELRELRSEVKHASDRMGVLEKRLRATLMESQ